jgi:hypothetical protein
VYERKEEKEKLNREEIEKDRALRMETRQLYKDECERQTARGRERKK